MNSQQPRVLFIFLNSTLIALLGLLVYLSYQLIPSEKKGPDSTSVYKEPDSNFTQLWTAPSDWRMMYLSPEEKKSVLYGRELIAHTSDYLGPKGSVKSISNGMNCQNCHLNAGTQPWGNNYFAVQSTYPKFRARSGSVEDQIKRVNDCFERSLNGQA
jgi:thiosulfate dehydrogenase